MSQSTETSLQLSARLRAEREVREWSLVELAERSGVSKAMISKIERSESSPTAAVLGKLSGAFGLTLSTLLARAESGASRLQRAKSQDQWRDPESGYFRRAVIAGPSSPFEVTEVTLPAGASVDMPRESYLFIRQAIWVLAGVLQFSEGTVTHRLSVGDSLLLAEPQDCRFENVSSRPCRYAVILLPR